MAYDDGLRAYEVKKPFEGVIPNLERRYKETESDWAREEIGRFMGETPCAACGGKRLKPEALAVKIAGFDIGDATGLSVRDARLWFDALPAKLTPKQNEIAGRILKEIRDRLTFLVDVGLEYLTLARPSRTLSGGESQRIRLASQIGSGLTGVLYVLDEPSIGLHQRDNERLLVTLKRLRDLGNTVIVVEHDEDAILQADYVFDIGPGAGIHGGEIVAQGTPQEIMDDPNSLTGQYLTGAMSVRTPAKRRKPAKSPHAQARRRARQQFEECHSGVSARHLHLHHRRVGRRQVDPRHRHALSRGGAQAQRRARASGARSTASRGSNISTRSSTSTSRRSGGRRDRTRRPISARSRRSASGLPACPRPRRGAISRGASPSTSRAGAARPARATASSRSRCTSCPTSTSPATSARASATTARRSR